MTITRLWQCGVETGGIAEFTGVTSNAAASTSQKKTGTYALAITGDGARYAYKTIAATRQIRVGFYYNNMTVSTASEINIISIKDASNNELVAIEGTGTLGTSSLILEIAGTNQDTEVGANPPSTWYHIGIDIKINSSTGWVKVYKDGTEILTFSGNTGNADIVDVVFGMGASNGSIAVYYDDMYIDDTTGESSAAKVPIKRFYFLTPNGNGNYSQWDGSDGNSTDNYLLVDDIPHDSDTTFLTTTVTDELDSFAMTTLTLSSGQQAIALIPIAIAKRNGTTEQIAIGTRLSSTDLVGSDQNPLTSYAPVSERQTAKPGGGSWAQSDIDGVEMVVKSRGTY